MGESVGEVWRCPKCDSEMFSEPHVKFTPLICRMGHAPTEMEQVFDRPDHEAVLERLKREASE